MRTREQADITGGHEEVEARTRPLESYIDPDARSSRDVWNANGGRFQYQGLETRFGFELSPSGAEREDRRGEERRGEEMRRGECGVRRNWVKRMLPLELVKREGEVEEQSS